MAPTRKLCASTIDTVEMRKRCTVSSDDARLLTYERSSLQGRMGSEAIFHSHTKKAHIMTAPTTNRAMTTALFHANEEPPPDIGT